MEWIDFGSLENMRMKREFKFCESIMTVLNTPYLFTKEDGENNNEGENNFFVKLFKHLANVFKSVINFVKSFFISLANFVKYIIRWIRERSTKHHEIWKKYKDKIKKIPYDLTFEAIPYRDTFVTNSNRLMDKIKRTPLGKVIEEIGINLKEAWKFIRGQGEPKAFLNKVLNIESIKLTDVTKLQDLAIDYFTFAVDIDKANEGISIEKQMAEKLNIEFYGTIEKPTKKVAVNCKKFLTPENISVLLPEYIDKIKDVMSFLKEIEKKASVIIVLSNSFYGFFHAFNDLLYKPVKDNISTDELTDKQKARKQKVELFQILLKYVKLVNMIVTNVKYTSYTVSITAMDYRNTVAKMLQFIGAQVDEIESDNKQTIFK